MRKLGRVLLRAVELGFIVFCLTAVALFFLTIPVPSDWVNGAIARMVPTNLVCRVDALSFNFVRGVTAHGVRVFDLTRANAHEPMASVSVLHVNPLARQVVLEGARYDRLPDGYYRPGNHEKNARVEATLPELPPFELTLVRPNILGVTPKKVIADVLVTPMCVSVERIHLDWPETREPMFLDGFCRVDLSAQEVVGEVRGSAIQKQIRPLLVALDLPVSLPYIDGFTEVPGRVPSYCGWHVNLVNNDFTLDLDLKPTMGRYRGVPMKRATGLLKLFVTTRGTSLNYHHVFGPIIGVGPNDEPLEGTVTVDGLNGTNTVLVKASSALPVAELLRIGGFEGDYVGKDVFGQSTCDLRFHFPRAMTNNYEVLNGSGHIRVKDGQLMRIKGFKGLIALLADRVPGVAWFTDSTQGSCDYTIENGILKSDNIYIEGSVFSIKMYGQFDAPRNNLDFTVRVQFTKKDSFMGKILHPLTWPFTKLLLEFKLTGSPDRPQWEYLSVIDRVLEAAQ